ncbi:hypothetical protein GCM10023144_26720 [Pigmentiphaga soli]|uniref:VWFA domain-containing protein n=1 Tax=Pigmentiphaga soli TaxID=1007095 RepID=A0ABP8H501_9BURK
MAADPRLPLAEFAGYLREHGYAVGYAEVALMARAAAALPPGQWPRAGALWRAIAAGDHRQWAQYPALHQAFWFPQAMRGATRSAGMTRRGRTLPELVEQLRGSGGDAPPRADAPLAGAAAGEGERRDAGVPRAQGGASRTEALERRDFSRWQAADLDRFDAIVRAFERRLRLRLLRRREPSTRTAAIHLRRSMRAALATGGELIRLHHVRPQRRRPRIALLVDVSRSMEVHARFFLQVARVFVDLLGARAFVFHTRLAEVTWLMAQRAERAVEKVDAMAVGFGGGTRIASCLRQAVDAHLRRSLGRGDLFIVFSDGYDTDDPDELAAALAGVRARGARVYWLHPTTQPAASAALARAAPLVDRFMAVHDLHSLARLPELLPG